MKERNEKPIRYRKIRDDCTVGSAEKILKKLGVPMSLTNPNGRNTRSDKKMKNFRKDYE